MLRAVIGMGSNLGDRESLLREAMRALSESVQILGRSRIYESLAVGPQQPDYLNAALLVETSKAPLVLLDVLLAIEAKLGRVRRERWGPRIIDLDLLYLVGESFDDARLKVPHPELLNRNFALAPLVDVLPQELWAKDALFALGGAPHVVGDLADL